MFHPGRCIALAHLPSVRAFPARWPVLPRAAPAREAQVRAPLWRSIRRRYAARAGTGEAGFRALGLSEELVRAVEEGLGFARPTPVQAAVIPRLLRGDSAVFSGGTGTGKTLAYALPLVAQLRAAEAAGVVPRPQRPRALVLVPSRELALQVRGVLRDLCRGAPLRTAVVHGGTRLAPQHERLEGALDVLVATPGRLLELREARRVHATDVRHVVLDEADTLFDASFRAEVAALLAPLADMARAGPARVQFVALGATLPPALVRDLQDTLPRLAVLPAPPLATVAHLAQTFVHVQQGEKHRRLLAALREQPPDAKSIVFCNTVASARSTQHALREAGIAAASLHGLVPPRRRAEEWEAFTSGAVRVLVCTDLAARGLDEPGVSHVVLFDFPRSVLDYIHRVGRTARALRPGAALSFVTKRDRALAQDIERAAQKRTDLWALVPSAPAGPAASSVRTSKQLPRWTRVVRDEKRAGGRAVVLPAGAGAKVVTKPVRRKRDE